jgi:hypothetical protein
MNRVPVPAVRLNPDLPPDLERIMKRALEKDRNLRYQSEAVLRAPYAARIRSNVAFCFSSKKARI